MAAPQVGVTEVRVVDHVLRITGGLQLHDTGPAVWSRARRHWPFWLAQFLDADATDDASGLQLHVTLQSLDGRDVDGVRLCFYLLGDHELPPVPGTWHDTDAAKTSGGERFSPPLDDTFRVSPLDGETVAVWRPDPTLARLPQETVGVHAFSLVVLGTVQPTGDDDWWVLEVVPGSVVVLPTDCRHLLAALGAEDVSLDWLRFTATLASGATSSTEALANLMSRWFHSTNLLYDGAGGNWCVPQTTVDGAQVFRVAAFFAFARAFTDEPEPMACFGFSFVLVSMAALLGVQLDPWAFSPGNVRRIRGVGWTSWKYPNAEGFFLQHFVAGTLAGTGKTGEAGPDEDHLLLYDASFQLDQGDNGHAPPHDPVLAAGVPMTRYKRWLCADPTTPLRPTKQKITVGGLFSTAILPTVSPYVLWQQLLERGATSTQVGTVMACCRTLQMVPTRVELTQPIVKGDETWLALIARSPLTGVIVSIEMRDTPAKGDGGEGLTAWSDQSGPSTVSCSESAGLLVAHRGPFRVQIQRLAGSADTLRALAEALA